MCVAPQGAFVYVEIRDLDGNLYRIDPMKSWELDVNIMPLIHAKCLKYKEK